MPHSHDTGNSKISRRLTYKILGCAIEVHKALGPGFLESVYEKCFTRELSLKGLRYCNQQCVPLSYKGLDLEAELRFDVLVEDLIVVELKSIDYFQPIHDSILLTYMSMLKKPRAS